MNQFWPNRPTPKGFSIEKLAKKYREKISSANGQDVEKNNYIGFDRMKSSLSTNKTGSTIDFSHWANRSFEEYRDAA